MNGENTEPSVVWSAPDSEGYSLLYIYGQYVGYIGVGVEPGTSKNYLESVETNGFKTQEEAKEDLLKKYRSVA
jgi:hypothetical protein